MSNRRNFIKATALSVGLASAGLLSFAANAADTIKVGVLHSLSGTMAISETALKETALMTIAEINKAMSKPARQINEHAGQVASGVNDAVVALQFQDLTTQLINHAQAGMASAHDIAGQVNKAIHQEADIDRGLANARTLLRAQATSGKAQGHPVKQESLNSGDIELF